MDLAYDIRVTDWKNAMRLDIENRLADGHAPESDRGNRNEDQVSSCRRSKRVRLVQAVCLFALLCLLSGTSQPCAAQLPLDRSDSAFAEALEQQQLFEVIVWDCESKFRNPKLSEARRSVVAAQWLRAKMLSALNASAEAQESAWAEVEALSEELTAETRHFPRHYLVRFQASVTGLAQARLIRLQLKSNPNDPLRQRGLESIRTSLMKLGMLQRELVDAAAGASPRPTTDEDSEFSRPQFQALGNDVDFQVLACLDVQSTLYPATDERSRVDGWQRILELSKTLQPKLPVESKLWWQAQAIALDAARNLEDWPEWKARWDAGILRFAPPEVLGEVAAAQLLHDLDQKKIDAAEKNAKNFVGLIKLRTPESLNGIAELTDLQVATAWPTFDIARARLFLDKAKKNDATGNLQQAEVQILNFANTMADRHGRFWAGQLTTELLAGGTPSSPSGPVSLILVREKISSAQWNEVQQLIAQGMKSAVESKQQEQALNLATLAASVGKAKGVEPWIVQAIENATLAFPENKRAESVHFFACILANQASASELPNRDRVWVAHLQKWPKSPQSDQIRVQLLGPTAIVKGELVSGLEYLDQVENSSQWLESAVQLMTATFSDQFESEFARDANRAHAFAAEWALRWKPRLQNQSDWLNRWTMPEKQLGLLLAQAMLESAPPQLSDADSLLQRIYDRLPELDGTSLSRWNVLRARLEFIKNPATFSPESLANLLGQCEAADLLWLTKCMARELPAAGLTQDTLSTNQRGRATKSAQAVLQLVDLLGKQNMDEAKSSWLRLQQVHALLQLNRFEDAKSLATQLAETHKGSLVFQQLLGYCLSGSNDPDDAQLAEKHWRRLTQQIETGTGKGTDAWFEAKYYIAEALRRKGQPEEAFKRLSYLKLTQPDEWESNRYRESLKRLLDSLAPK